MSATKREHDGYRDISFSLFHRLLDKRLYVTNVDYVEYKYENGRIVFVAIIEEKKHVQDMNEEQEAVMQQLAATLDVPLFLVAPVSPIITGTGAKIVVEARNDKAREFIEGHPKVLSFLDFEIFLKRLRGEKPPPVESYAALQRRVDKMRGTIDDDIAYRAFLGMLKAALTMRTSNEIATIVQYLINSFMRRVFERVDEFEKEVTRCS